MENLKIEEKEQAEFLVKTGDGYILQMLDASLEHDGCLRVPDGANAYIKIVNGSGNSYFYKFGEKESFNYKSEEWSLIHTKYNSIDPFIMDGDTILWQRHTQPEELPKSLNDQYAEIEAVRQTAFDMQISGNHYKLLPIQPMKFALANGLDYAQGNVIKYVIRHASKGGKEDLLKAIHNIELMIQHYYGDQ